MAITYPVPASTFPSAEWWANLAASTQASIDAAQNAAVTTAAANTSSAVASAQAALQAAIDGKAPTVHTHTRAQISDATTLGRDLLGAASPAVARESIGAFAWHDYVGTGSLDAVVEHGIYRQHSGEWAQVANGYPVDNVPGMLEVFRLSSTVRVQRYTSDRPEGGMWTRRGSLDGSVWSWSAWVAYAPTRVDTTVGTRVFVGGVMVHGDTGWRLINDSVLVPTENPRILIRRTGSLVTLSADRLDLAASHPAGTDLILLPSGFRPPALIPWRYSGAYEAGAIYTTGPYVRPRTTIAAGGNRFYVQFIADDPWPTTLPGTPA